MRNCLAVYPRSAAAGDAAPWKETPEVCFCPSAYGLYWRKSCVMVWLWKHKCTVVSITIFVEDTIDFQSISEHCCFISFLDRIVLKWKSCCEHVWAPSCRWQPGVKVIMRVPQCLEHFHEEIAGAGNSYGMFQSVRIGSLLQQALRTVCISLPVPPIRTIPEGAN